MHALEVQILYCIGLKTTASISQTCAISLEIFAVFYRWSLNNFRSTFFLLYALWTCISLKTCVHIHVGTVSNLALSRVVHSHAPALDHHHYCLSHYIQLEIHTSCNLTQKGTNIQIYLKHSENNCCYLTQEIVLSNHVVEQMKEQLVISLFSSYQFLFGLPYKAHQLHNCHTHTHGVLTNKQLNLLNHFRKEKT